MSIVLLRHRRDEAALLAPASHRAPVPVERPRGIAPARLGCAPGTSRQVLDELMAAGAREQQRTTPADPAALIAHAWWIIIAPLMAALAEPEPDTDWADKVRGVAAITARRISGVAAETTRILQKVLFAEGYAWRDLEIAAGALKDRAAGVLAELPAEVAV